MQTETIYILPPWAITTVAVAVAISVAGLAIYLVAVSMNQFLNLSAQLEVKRRHKETKALNNWQRVYEDEKALHMQDVSDLTGQIIKLEQDNDRMKKLLAKVRVADL